MPENNNEPREYNLVVEGNNPLPIDALVLSGIEGLKQRFTKANSDSEKIAILRDALKYDEAGAEFLSDIFSVEKGKIKWIAAALISATNNEIYKDLLVEYLANVLINHPDNWNNWKQEVIEIDIYLKGINLYYSTFINRDFSHINFMNSDLMQARFYKCNIYNTDFCQANLAYSFFGYTNLISTKFIDADLNGADFNGSQLIKVDLRKANLTFVDFCSAKLEGVKFGNNDVLKKNTVVGINFESTVLNKIKFQNISFLFL